MEVNILQCMVFMNTASTGHTQGSVTGGNEPLSHTHGGCTVVPFTPHTARPRERLAPHRRVSAWLIMRGGALPLLCRPRALAGLPRPAD